MNGAAQLISEGRPGTARKAPGAFPGPRALGNAEPFGNKGFSPPSALNPHDERNRRVCGKCREEKSVAAFYWDKRGWYERRCHDCRRSYKREHWRAHYAKQDRRWRPEQTEELRRHIEAGATPEEAAVAMGRTRDAVLSHRQRQSLPKFKRPFIPHLSRNAALAPQVANVLALGLSYSQAAERFECSRGKIAGICRAYKIPPRPQESRRHAAIGLPNLRPSSRAARIVSLPSIECCGAPGALR